MFSSILSVVLLSASLSTADVAPAGPSLGNPITTQTLHLRAPAGESIMVGCHAVTDTTIVLQDAHVAFSVDRGGEAFNVVLPDGKVHYKGDLVITVQSQRAGTAKYDLRGGEATLAIVDVDADARRQRVATSN